MASIVAAAPTNLTKDMRQAVLRVDPEPRERMNRWFAPRVFNDFDPIKPIWVVVGALFILFHIAGCSPGEPVLPSDSTQSQNGDSEQSTDPDTDRASESTDFAGSDATDDDASDLDGVVAGDTPGPTATPVVLKIGVDRVVEIIDLSGGEQQIDTQGNLITIYGLAAWPAAFDDLPASSRQQFDFVSDLAPLSDPSLNLVALDVGMCAAGIDASGFGTAEFSVHDEPTDGLATGLDGPVMTAQPIAESGFAFPDPARCTRGWLPLVWRGDDAPEIGRYVLTNRTTNDASIERHVYQWDLTGLLTTDLVESPAAIETQLVDTGQFDTGQTVTFNDGALKDTTVSVKGWAELVGQRAPVDGTRLVAVQMSFCPSTLRLPDFGLAVDGWNLVAPQSGADLLGAATAADPTQSCYDGWLQFAIPYGAVPTGFFTSDGANVETGYAYWSLNGAALPAPEE